MNSAVKHQADEALKKAYKLCYTPLIKYCNVRKGDAAVSADDCVQEAFLVYYNKLLSGETFENPRAFLYRTADNFLKQAIEQYVRHRNRTVPLEDAENLSASLQDFPHHLHTNSSILPTANPIFSSFQHAKSACSADP